MDIGGAKCSSLIFWFNDKLENSEWNVEINDSVNSFIDDQRTLNPIFKHDMYSDTNSSISFNGKVFNCLSATSRCNLRCGSMLNVKDLKFEPPRFHQPNRINCIQNFWKSTNKAYGLNPNYINRTIDAKPISWDGKLFWKKWYYCMAVLS